MTSKELQKEAEKNAQQAMRWFQKAMEEYHKEPLSIDRCFAMAAPIAEYNAWSEKAIKLAKLAKYSSPNDPDPRSN